MQKKKKIIEAVYSAIDELNQLLPPDNQLPKALTTPIVHESSKLDSQALVNLIVALEEELDKHFNTSISLIEEETMFTENTHYTDVNTLIKYVYTKLEEE